jgi:hypothetical protein
LHSNQLTGATHGFENASRRRHNSRFEAPGGTAQRVSAGAQYIAARIPRYWNEIVIAANAANAAMNPTRILIDSDIRRTLT